MWVRAQNDTGMGERESWRMVSGTLTFLFTDIEGSTQRWGLDRDAMAVALGRHDAHRDRQSTTRR